MRLRYEPSAKRCSQGNRKFFLILRGSEYMNVGYKENNELFNGVIHDAALLNYAVTPADALRIGRFGVIQQDRWGTSYPLIKKGAILKLNMQLGYGTSIPDDTDFGQHG